MDVNTFLPSNAFHTGTCCVTFITHALSSTHLSQSKDHGLLFPLMMVARWSGFVVGSMVKLSLLVVVGRVAISFSSSISLDGNRGPGERSSEE